MQPNTATYFAKSQHPQVLSESIDPSKKKVLEELKESTSALSQDTSLSHTDVSEFAQFHCQTKKAQDLDSKFSEHQLNVNSDLEIESQNLNSDFQGT